MQIIIYPVYGRSNYPDAFGVELSNNGRIFRTKEFSTMFSKRLGFGRARCYANTLKQIYPFSQIFYNG